MGTWGNTYATAHRHPRHRCGPGRHVDPRGYAFAFLRFKGKKFLFFVVLSTLMVPTEVTIVGNLDTIASFIGPIRSPRSSFRFLDGGSASSSCVKLPSATDELRDAAAWWVQPLRFLDARRRAAGPTPIAALSLFSFLSRGIILRPLRSPRRLQRTVQIGLKQLAALTRQASSAWPARSSPVPIAILLGVFERHSCAVSPGAVKGDATVERRSVT